MLIFACPAIRASVHASQPLSPSRGPLSACWGSCRCRNTADRIRPGFERCPLLLGAVVSQSPSWAQVALHNSEAPEWFCQARCTPVSLSASRGQVGSIRWRLILVFVPFTADCARRNPYRRPPKFAKLKTSCPNPVALYAPPPFGLSSPSFGPE
jgi:hypothetical protein